MVWKQKLLLLLIWATVTVSGVFYVGRIKPIYRAETLILVDSQKIPDKYVTTTVVSDVQDRLATLSQEILSSTRIKKIIDDYKLYSDRRDLGPEELVAVMRNDIDLKIEKGWSNNRPGAFRIAYQGPSPEVVAQVANRLASLYIEENLKVRELQASGTSEFMDAQLKDAKTRLDEMEAAVSKYKLEHNGELPQQENAITTTLVRLQTQLQANQDAVNRAQQNKILFDNERGSAEASLSTLTNTAEAAASSGTTTGGAVSTANAPTGASGVQKQSQSQLLEAELTALKARYSDQHPDVKRAALALAQAKAAEAATVSSSIGSAVKGTAPQTVAAAPTPARVAANPEMLREIDRLSQRISALKVQSSLAEKEIRDRTDEGRKIFTEMSSTELQLKRLPIREQEMAGLTRDYEISKSNYRSLLDKKISADMSTDMERRQKAERFNQIDPAVIPDRPVKPNRPVLMGMSAILGLALGLVVSLGKEMKRGVVLGEWELPKDITILGRIPLVDLSAPAMSGTNSGGRRKASKKKSKLRLALIYSAVLSLLAGAGAGIYVLRRF